MDKILMSFEGATQRDTRDRPARLAPEADDLNLDPGSAHLGIHDAARPPSEIPNDLPPENVPEPPVETPPDLPPEDVPEPPVETPPDLPPEDVPPGGPTEIPKP